SKIPIPHSVTTAQGQAEFSFRVGSTTKTTETEIHGIYLRTHCNHSQLRFCIKSSKIVSVTEHDRDHTNMSVYILGLLHSKTEITQGACDIRIIVKAIEYFSGSPEANIVGVTKIAHRQGNFGPYTYSMEPVLSHYGSSK